MTDPKILNTIGLLLGLVGVIIIFIWGPPQPALEEGIGLGLEDNTPINENGKTVKQHNDEIRQKRKRHNILSRVGLGLIFLGFLFQLFATWV
ncbi:MAG TPA: hypothetical protein VLZ83_03425 [Edaphocola sp.]|nr:hypothetical protein [Edaphocola sp.]